MLFLLTQNVFRGKSRREMFLIFKRESSDVYFDSDLSQRKRFSYANYSIIELSRIISSELRRKFSSED